MEEEKGTVKINADGAEIVLSYRLSNETLKRVLNLIDRIANEKAINKLWRNLIRKSRRKGSNK